MIYKWSLVFGLIMILSGVVIVAIPESKMFVSEEVKSVATYWQPPMGLPGKMQIRTVSTALTYPSSVNTNESFLVTLKVTEISSVDYVGIIDRDKLPAPEKLTNEATSLKDLAFVLDIQGVEVTPKSATATSRDGVINWSAMAKSAGDFKGVIRFDLQTVQEKEKIRDVPLEKFEFEKPVEVTISASDPWFTRKTLIAGILAFLGSLATLPGIVAFWRTSKEAKSEGKGNTNSTLILPGDTRYTPPERRL